MFNREEKEFIRNHRGEDADALALKMKNMPGFDKASVLRQLAGYRAALKKMPYILSYEDIVFPVSLSMEQCSSEKTAEYKAGVISGCFHSVAVMADLTGGFGVDFYFLSRKFGFAFFVEKNQELCAIAGHNFSVLNMKNVSIENCDGTDFLEHSKEKFDFLYLDPARRDKNGKKVVSISDCEPDLLKLLPLIGRKADAVMVKFSPMLDISKAISQIGEVIAGYNISLSVSQIHVVSVGGECKELIIYIDRGNTSHINCFCVDLRNGGRDYTDKFEYDCKSVCSYSESILSFLYEPNASLMKASGFGYLCEKYSCKKVGINSHLFTSDDFIRNFPGRSFSVENVLPYKSKLVKKVYPELKKANITVRNFPDNVNMIRKRLKFSEGGDIYIFATTLNDNIRVLAFCRKC